MKKIIFLGIMFLCLVFPTAAHAGTVYSKLNKLSNIAYLAGKSIYAKKSDLSAGQAYETCKYFMLAYNKKLVADNNGNPNYKQFLYYMSPAEITYCFVGYLDATSQGK